MKPGKGGQIARSAGTSARLVAKEGIYSTLRLQSGEMRKVLSDCRATLEQYQIRRIILSLSEKLEQTDGEERDQL